MPPALNRELKDPGTIEEAFAAMKMHSIFKFNERKKQLRATQAGNGWLIASVLGHENATAHRFVWKDVERPKHKPREGQTNNVHRLSVGSYGQQPTRNSQLAQELHHYFAGMEHVEVYDAGGGRALVVGAVGSAKPGIQKKGYEVNRAINERAIEVNYNA